MNVKRTKIVASKTLHDHHQRISSRRKSCKTSGPLIISQGSDTTHSRCGGILNDSCEITDYSIRFCNAIYIKKHYYRIFTRFYVKQIQYYTQNKTKI